METTFSEPEYAIALQAKIRRISRLLTKQEIASIVHVSQEDVDLFERGQTMNTTAKRKLLNAYIYRNTFNQYLLDHLYPS